MTARRPTYPRITRCDLLPSGRYDAAAECAACVKPAKYRVDFARIWARTEPFTLCDEHTAMLVDGDFELFDDAIANKRRPPLPPAA